ncbi:MAG: cysteine peptidase family C39 domain-containing protein [Aestuariibaculum sp.]
MTNCGATCLASIAAHYNLQIPIARIRQYAGIDKKGTNILDLIEASQKLCFEAKGVRGTLDSLVKIPKQGTHKELYNKKEHYYNLWQQQIPVSFE